MINNKKSKFVPAINLKIGDELILGNTIVRIEQLDNNLIKLHCNKNKTSFVISRNSQMLVFNR